MCGGVGRHRCPEGRSREEGEEAGINGVPRLGVGEAGSRRRALKDGVLGARGVTARREAGG